MTTNFKNMGYATLSAKKEADITADMLAQIERVTGTQVSADEVAVFETIALNTRPLTKSGSIFHNAVVSQDTLRQMAAKLNSGEESVPLHTMHQQGYELPVGRVFQAEVHATQDGGAELRALFFVPKSEAALVEKINLGILDEVSVGLKSKQMLCSKCGFDYLGPEANYGHFWSQTCENDHTIGEDGTHIKMEGLDTWMELSLVSRGASSKPKILGRAKQVMGQETYDRIAASGITPEAVVLFTGSQEKEPVMTQKNEGATEDAKFDAKEAIEALTAGLAEVKTLIEGLAASESEEAEEINAPSIEDLQAQLEAANAEIADLKAAATSEEEEEEGEGDTETSLEGQGNLPVGGVAAAAVEDAGLKGSAFPTSSFKTRK